MGDDGRWQWVVSVFGSNRRSGPWRARPRVRAVAVFGSCFLDLRQMEPGEKDAEIWAFATFGDVHVVVDPQSAVELSGVAVFGDRRSTVAGPSSGGPRVRVKGVALFGDVDVDDSVVPSP